MIMLVTLCTEIPQASLGTVTAVHQRLLANACDDNGDSNQQINLAQTTEDATKSCLL